MIEGNINDETQKQMNNMFFFFSSFFSNFIISVSKGEKKLKVDLIFISESYGYPYKISEPIFQFAMCISLFKGTDQRKYLPYFINKPIRYFIFRSN